MNNNPDLLYLRSREDLLRYEDARFNSLIQAMADYYPTRNDQSIWGNFLRGLAQELSKLDYDYSYDLVNKDPSLLTPPDIRRRWAAPLYISANWPAPGQYDVQYKLMLDMLITAYREGTTVAAIQAVIFAYTGINIQVVELYKQIGNGVYDQSDRNAINVSVQVGGAGGNPLAEISSLTQLQIIVQSLYNAIDLAKPAHVGLEFTTVFGESEDLDCILTPSAVTQAQFIELDSTTASYFTFTNYVPLSPALFWKKDTAFVLNNVLRDSNGNFQLVTSVGAFPNQSGATQPIWNTISFENTTDGNLTLLDISPAVLTTSRMSNFITVALSYQVGLAPGDVVTLINLSGAQSAALNGVPLTVTAVNGASFTAANIGSAYGTETETTGTATFALPTPITALQFAALNPTWQSLYQKQYTNTNCQASGITDTLRIFIQQVETPPQGPMLILAGETITAKTTIAAYGRLLSSQRTPTQWASLPTVFVNITSAFSDGKNATYFYVPQSQFLHEGEAVTIQGFSNAALNVTARIQNVYNSVANINAVQIEGDVLTVFAPNLFTPGMLVNLSGLTAATFLNGQSLVITSATPVSFTAAFTNANYTKVTDTGTGEVSTFQIPNTTVVAPLTATTSANAGMLSPTLQSGYYFSNGNYALGQPPIAATGSGVGSSWVPSGAVFLGQIVVDSNGNQQIALNPGTSDVNPPSPWSSSLNATSMDNGVRWRNVGKNFFSVPNTWVGVLNFNANQTPVPFSGEVGNVDPNHQYGLVAPRLNQVWELSGQPQDQDFIFGLF